MLQLHSLTANDIQSTLNLLADNHSQSTVKKARDAMNDCFKLGVIRREIARNPVDGTVLPKNCAIKKKEIQAFSSEEVKLILNEAIRVHSNGTMVYRYGYVIHLLLNTGMRIGEALALKWEDVKLDADNPYLVVKASVSEVKDRSVKATASYVHIEQTTKTRAGNRIVPINKQSKEALLKLKEIIGDESRVIATANGTITSARNIYRMLSNILKVCHINGAVDCVHALRHTFATNCLCSGVPVEVVSKMLGHSEVSTTYNTYIHVIREQQHIAVGKIEDLYK